MSFLELITKNEKIFKGAKDINYLFCPSTSHSDYLIVCFSGFNGREAKGGKTSYNYLKVLSSIDCNRLFILDDYQGVPCYYLGKNKVLDYEVSVAALILKIANEQKIPYTNIIACGSSKGGTAAVYFGIKYHLGHIVTGGFQVKVGDYLYNNNSYTREKVLKAITGGSTEKDKDYLNNFYLDFIKNAKVSSNLHIHGGVGDPHFLNHVTIFTDIMKERNIPFNLDVQNYHSHAEIGTFYSNFLIEKMSEITGIISIKDTTIEINEKNELIASCSIPDYFANDKSVKYAYYIYKEGKKEPVSKIMYSGKSTLVYKVNEPGKYRVRVFVKNEKNTIAQGTPSLVI